MKPSKAQVYSLAPEREISPILCQIPTFSLDILHRMDKIQVFRFFPMSLLSHFSLLAKHLGDSRLVGLPRQVDYVATFLIYVTSMAHRLFLWFRVFRLHSLCITQEGEGDFC